MPRIRQDVVNAKGAINFARSLTSPIVPFPCASVALEDENGHGAQRFFGGEKGAGSLDAIDKH